MSDLVPQGPQKLTRKTRTKRASEEIKFTAPAAADPQSTLDAQLAAIEQNKETMGYNVALSLTEASQRGFATGLQKGLQSGAVTEASFFSNCIAAAGASLL
jgi:hypothetical protein